jgi:hypothetical protein
MSSTASPAQTQRSGFSSKLRNSAVGALFALLLLIPKIIHLRRSPKAWLVFRILLGLSGAALVVLPLAFWNTWLAALAGLAMFLLAALLPPAKPDLSADDAARELGALVVVNGGRYQPGNAAAAAVQLFVGAERVWALDSHLKPVLVIPVPEMTSARAELIEGHWYLSIRWADHYAEFSYRGIFSEHLARVAESTLHSVMLPALPVIPQRRAASA